MSQWHFLVLATVVAAPLQAQNASLVEVQDTSMLVKPRITSTLMLTDAVLQARQSRHSIRPGTRTPFSSCAGT